MSNREYKQQHIVIKLTQHQHQVLLYYSHIYTNTNTNTPHNKNCLLSKARKLYY